MRVIRSIGIVVFIVMMACAVWAADKVEPTKEQLVMQAQVLTEKMGRLQAEYALAVRDLEAVRAALKKMDEAGKAAEKKDEKK
jgi:hypothetical protein